MNRRYWFVAGVMALCLGGTAQAYEEITVPDGGTLRGTVKLDGQVPSRKATT